jgi:hypothetical protein
MEADDSEHFQVTFCGYDGQSGLVEFRVEHF